MDEAPIPKLLLPPAQAAEVLSVSVRTLERMEKRGELSAIRIGRSVRYSVAALQEWIARQEGAAQ